MTHLLARIRPTRHHTGTWLHYGNAGFFVAVGVAVVLLLILFGIYELAHNALLGIADMAAGTTS